MSSLMVHPRKCRLTSQRNQTRAVRRVCRRPRREAPQLVSRVRRCGKPGRMKRCERARPARLIPKDCQSIGKRKASMRKERVRQMNRVLEIAAQRWSAGTFALPPVLVGHSQDEVIYVNH